MTKRLHFSSSILDHTLFTGNNNMHFGMQMNTKCPNTEIKK